MSPQKRAYKIDYIITQLTISNIYPPEEKRKFGVNFKNSQKNEIVIACQRYISERSIV